MCWTEFLLRENLVKNPCAIHAVFRDGRRPKTKPAAAKSSVVVLPVNQRCKRAIDEKGREEPWKSLRLKKGIYHGISV
jgi:hypothetical protein